MYVYGIYRQIGTKLELDIFWRPVETLLCPIFKSPTGGSNLMKPIPVENVENGLSLEQRI